MRRGRRRPSATSYPRTAARLSSKFGDRRLVVDDQDAFAVLIGYRLAVPGCRALCDRHLLDSPVSVELRCEFAERFKQRT